VFLGESVTVEELAGMILILGGVALGSGAVRLPRRAAAPATPAP
jgi:drug/metabolite transporter (DMT)-like permease